MKNDELIDIETIRWMWTKSVQSGLEKLFFSISNKVWVKTRRLKFCLIPQKWLLLESKLNLEVNQELKNEVLYIFVAQMTLEIQQNL